MLRTYSWSDARKYRDTWWTQVQRRDNAASPSSELGFVIEKETGAYIDFFAFFSCLFLDFVASLRAYSRRLFIL